MRTDIRLRGLFQVRNPTGALPRLQGELPKLFKEHSLFSFLGFPSPFEPGVLRVVRGVDRARSSCTTGRPSARRGGRDTTAGTSSTRGHEWGRLGTSNWSPCTAAPLRGPDLG